MDRFSKAYEAAQEVVKADKYPGDWSMVMSKAKQLMAGADGPSAAKADATDAVRKKIKDDTTGAKTAGSVIVAASDEPAGVDVKRAATLKMLRHLYLVEAGSNQKLWIYSPPKAYTKWVFEELVGSKTAITAKLDDEAELYTLENRQIMAEAAIQSRAVCGKAQAELSIKTGATAVSSSAQAKVKKWIFGDATVSDTDMNAAITRLRDGYKKIGTACGAGTIIFSDEPTYRNKPGKWQNYAMVRPDEAMLVLYLMKGFLDEAGKPKKADRWLCVETIIHELSHKIEKTDDYVYDHQGLKPGGSKFPAGAGIDNADSWGYLACDIAGMLPSSTETSVYKTPTKALKIWSKPGGS